MEAVVSTINLFTFLTLMLLAAIWLQVGRHFHLMELLLSCPAIEINAQDEQVFFPFIRYIQHHCKR